MFALRRVAVRAISQQLTKPTLRQATRVTPFQLQSTKPTLLRSFHSTRVWLAEEDKKVDEAVETVKEEAAEVAEELKDGAESATEQVHESAKSATEQAQETASSVVDQAKEYASSATESVSAAAAAVTGAASSAAATATGPYQAQSNDRWPSRDSGAGPNEVTKILYIGNLFFEVTEQQLEAEFGQFGKVARSRIVTDPRGMSKGFGYVEFESQADTDRALRELDQKVLSGRRMAVQYHARRERDTYQSGNSARRPQRDNFQEPLAPSKTLFIGNMSYQMSDRDLNDLFREIRNVLDVRVAIDRRSGQPRGFAHADFTDIASAEKAKEHLSQKTVYGRQLRVDYSAQSSQSRPDRS